MRRRELIGLLAGSVFGSPLLARAEALPLVNFLNSRTSANGQSVAAAFKQGLRGTGFHEDQNVAIEYRWAEDQYDCPRSLRN